MKGVTLGAFVFGLLVLAVPVLAEDPYAYGHDRDRSNDSGYWDGYRAGQQADPYSKSLLHDPYRLRSEPGESLLKEPRYDTPENSRRPSNGGSLLRQ